MAKPLQSASIAAPGFFGLNTQASSITLAAGFALKADNCVIDKFGRLGARKGYRVLSNSVSDLKGMHRFIDIDGIETFITWNDTSFYQYDETPTLASITVTTGNTLVEGNWDACTLNDKAFFFQRGYTPMQYSTVAGTITDVPSGPPQANVCLSAYGRVWAADTATNKTTVYWSNLLDGADFGTGTAGSVDLSAVLVNGNDDIVSLGAANGRLIIFCKNNIVIYGSNSGDSTLNPATMELVEVITGVGCACRDSVQNTGTDIFFLSYDGLRSLGRVIQEKSQPMRDLSLNVRDDLVSDLLTSADTSAIKSVYSSDNAFYLLLFPQYDRIYCFDTRAPLQDGALRATLWDSIEYTNMLADEESVYFTTPSGFADYFGYTDNGAVYTMKYYTNYFDFDDSSKTKILKRLSITLIGGSGQDFVLKAGYDYSDSYRSFPVNIQDKLNAEYGIAEFNTVWEYTTGTLADTIRAPMGGSGNVLQVGFEADIDSVELSIQKLDIYIKQGRTY